VILVGLAIDQIAQSGLSSLSVIYYSAQLFRAESLKLTVDDINKHDEKLVKLKASAMNCIPFNKGEIHVWDSPILEPIYYEKIKIKNENSMIKLMQSLK
ncbi:hypothetical protein P9921_27915, partial [Serratia nevei]|nr:hypothetical protein [Serratia nevei]